jgi:alpha-tubulin suppressor-like RCC1 family protein
VPVQIATGVRQASASGYTEGDNYGHSVFVKTDNTLWVMGRNNYGQLGNGTTTNNSTPIQVAAGVSQASDILTCACRIFAGGENRWSC